MSKKDNFEFYICFEKNVDFVFTIAFLQTIIEGRLLEKGIFYGEKRGFLK